MIIVTAILGRVFCGWICPLGTLHHLAGKLKKGTVPVKISGLYRIKYLLLIFILVLASGGGQLAGVFAPLVLNLREKRFWCKYLCPLLKRSVSEDCHGCGACLRGCQGGAGFPDGMGGPVVAKVKAWESAECLMCLSCDDPCPKNAVSFGFARKPAAAARDLGKRRVLGSVLAGIAATPLLRITPLARAGVAPPTLIRPPPAP